MNLDRNDFKMSTISTKYYYNGDNVTVELAASLTAPNVFYPIFGYIYKVVKATAKCNPEDTYDKQMGEKIALARAEAKAYRQLCDEMKRRWKYVLEAIETLAPLKASFEEKTNNCVEHNERYVDALPTNDTY